jgi:two-component system chemotaxis sensor kinase CheA
VNELLDQFLIEARELVEQASSDLLALETQAGDRERLDSAFRAFHTLKGAAGIVEFDAMGRALHVAEDALETVRGGRRALTSSLVSDCLAALDQVLLWLEAMEAEGAAPRDADVAADALVARFTEASGGGSPKGAIAAPEVAAPAELRVLAAQVAMLEAAGADGIEGRLGSAARVAANALARLGRPAAPMEAALEHARAAGDVAILVEALRRALDESAPAPAAVAAAPAAETQEPAVRALRVDIERVDALVRLTGEITAVKTAIGHLVDQADAAGDPQALAASLKAQHAQLDRLVSELQHAVLGIRVLPLRQVFQRFPRLVRELGLQLGKPVRLLTEGDDTEADKAIVEALFEPLLHLLRNAIDHGVEDEDRRRAAGKAPLGAIVLRGERRGEQVVIEVQDDGGGIDLDRVRAAAVERGLLSAAAIETLSEQEVADLVFAPGFSTAAAVSDLSGRGVGMDAARHAIERMGGHAAIESRRGEGTLVRLTLPFTVMMTRVLTVEAGGQTYGMAFDSVIETIRVRPEAISPIGAARALVHRNRTITIVDLAETLGVGAGGQAANSDATIVVVGVSGDLVGLQVDRVGERMDVMLRPIGGLLTGMAGVSGATVLGDGRVLLVLDLHDLAA